MSRLARVLVRIAAAFSPLSVALGAWRTIPSITPTKGATMQPIGPLAIILRRTKASTRTTLAIAVVLTAALLGGVTLLIL